MVTVYDVPPEALIEALTEELAGRIEPPEWAVVAKSGVDREFPPEEPDFWYRRGASILRRIAIDGPIGVDRLSTYYGGPKGGSNRYRVAPKHRADASRNQIRTLIQQLEAEGLLERPPNNEGRTVSSEGRSLLDRMAGEVLKELDRPELDRYA